MAKTFDKCQKCNYKATTCVFAQLEKTNNKLDVANTNICNIGESDNYALIPEISIDSKTGLNIWHSIYNSDNNPFIINPYNYKMTQFIRDDSINPNMHLIDWNVPQNKSKHINPTQTVSLVGYNEFHLVDDRWSTDTYNEPYKAIHIPSVKTCENGLYGLIDANKGIVVHKSMRNQLQYFPKWKNYCVSRYYTQSKLNIFEDNINDIITKIKKVITYNITQNRIIDAIKLIKEGKYLNIITLLKNNNVSEQETQELTSNISFKNERDIRYSKTGTKYDLRKIFRLYKVISNGKIPCETKDKNRYLANILNFVLNDKKLSKIPIGLKSYEPSNRYHFIIELVKLGIKDNMIQKPTEKTYNLPQWFKTLLLEHKKCDINEEINPNDINPAVIIVRDILDIKNEDIYNSFKVILRKISEISIFELQVIWKTWLHAKTINKSDMFWEIIYKYSEGEDPYNICTEDRIKNTYNWSNTLYDSCIDHDTFETYE